MLPEGKPVAVALVALVVVVDIKEGGVGAELVDPGVGGGLSEEEEEGEGEG